MWIIFAAVFLAIMALAVVGLFAPQFKDNALQCVGLVLLSAWAADQASQVIATRYVGAMQALVGAALLCYGTGVAAKVYKFTRKERDDGQTSVFRSQVRS